MRLRACLTNGLSTTVELFQVISSYIYLMAVNGSVQLGEFSGVDKEYSMDPSKLLQGTVGAGGWDKIVYTFFPLFRAIRSFALDVALHYILCSINNYVSGKSPQGW